MTVIHIIYGLQFHLHTYTKFRFAQPTVCFDKYILSMQKRNKNADINVRICYTLKNDTITFMNSTNKCVELVEAIL